MPRARAEQRGRSAFTPRRVLGYARVSSEEQTKGTSLRDQEAAIREYARSIGVSVAKVYVEAESGGGESIELREQMKALMADVREGDLVCVLRLDRWSRDVPYAYNSVKRIVDAGADFYLLNERVGPRDDNWRTIFGINALVADIERDRIFRRTVGTRRLLRDQGLYSEGKVPLGYARRLPRGLRGEDADGKPKNELVIVEHEARAVREIFAKVIAGHSLREIENLVTVRAPDGRTRKLTHGTIRRVVARRFYTGEMQDTSGDWIDGKQPAIIDVDVFTQARSILEKRRRTATGPRGEGRTSDWLLRDVARCALCGARCGSVYGGRRDDGSYSRVYYLCVRSKECGARNVRVETVEASAEPMILARLEELREDLSRPPPASVTPIRVVSIAERRTRETQKRARLIEQYQEGDIPRDQYKAKLAKCDAELLRLEGEERASKRVSPLADPAVRRAALANVAIIRSAWAKATTRERREIVRELADEARIAAGQPVEFVWISAENIAEQSVNGLDRM